jgi:hypothetical protein
VGEAYGLVKPAVRQGRVEPLARPFDGAVPQSRIAADPRGTRG